MRDQSFNHIRAGDEGQATASGGDSNDLTRRLQEVRSKVVEAEAKYTSHLRHPGSASHGRVLGKDPPRYTTDQDSLSSYKYPSIPRQSAFNASPPPPPISVQQPAIVPDTSYSLPPEVPAKIQEPRGHSPQP